MAQEERQHRLLSRSSWRTVPISYAEIRGTNRYLRMLLVLESDDNAVIGGVPNWRWHFEQQRALRQATEVRLVGEIPGRVVVMVDGCDRLIGMRSPRTTRTERRWRRAFESPRRRGLFLWSSSYHPDPTPTERAGERP